MGRRKRKRGVGGKWVGGKEKGQTKAGIREKKREVKKSKGS